MLDGTPTLRLNEFMLGGLDKGVIPLELPEGERDTKPMPEPEEIKFDLKGMEDVVTKSQKGFEDEMALQDLKVRTSHLVFAAGVLAEPPGRWSTLPATGRTPSRLTRSLLMLGYK